MVYAKGYIPWYGVWCKAYPPPPQICFFSLSFYVLRASTLRLRHRHGPHGHTHPQKIHRTTHIHTTHPPSVFTRRVLRILRMNTRVNPHSLRARPYTVPQPISLYKIFVTSRLLCTNQPSFRSRRPPALLTLVQYYCTILGQYTTSIPTSRLYAKHHTVLVITISCKGQKPTGRQPQSNGKRPMLMLTPIPKIKGGLGPRSALRHIITTGATKSNQTKNTHTATHGQGEADPSATTRVANPASRSDADAGLGGCERVATALVCEARSSFV